MVLAEYDAVPGLVDTTFSWNSDMIRIANSGEMLIVTPLNVLPSGKIFGAFTAGAGGISTIGVTGQVG